MYKGRPFKFLLKNLLIFAVLILSGCSGVNTNISKKAVLIVSFGTSFVETRKLNIDETERVISEAFPEYDKFIAFTSQIIINIYKDRDNIEYMNVSQAIEEIYRKKYGEVLIVPTLVINGDEYDEIIESIEPFKDKFSRMIVSKPLLSSMSDYTEVAEALVKDLPEIDSETAVVYMGHGTPHHANSAYPAFDFVIKHLGYSNIYMGTVEGFPTFDNVVEDLKKKNYKKILLIPFMIVAGDHAFNDMAGDEADSWKIMLKSMGYKVDYQLKGMGEQPEIRELFVKHAKEAVRDFK